MPSLKVKNGEDEVARTSSSPIVKDYWIKISNMEITLTEEDPPAAVLSHVHRPHVRLFSALKVFS